MAQNPLGLSSYPPSDTLGLFPPGLRLVLAESSSSSSSQPPRMSSMYMTNPSASASSSATPAPVQQASANAAAPGHTISEAERASLRQRFQSELDQLEEMGFLDQDKNLRALSVTNGDLSLALNLIADNDD
ncbi:hypothetical protein DL89DRAFT_179712 [Linderina pennispora]|uniref:UBA domain-containing protein n=1 Tax=Linderina pennispora TaxID=61395 RepID=A0A1Y1W4T9_9FUNG|nr:uncharacterized protein DL89DRAFT_179712 [Linderina pennispora]ORX68563.1 hypothetical protein DL89DRAFT_179712 [Linderina pennispora]